MTKRSAGAAATIAMLVLASGPLARSGDPGCRAEVGSRRAADLRRQCRDVSPAPAGCREGSTCSALTEEIRRGCRLAGDDAPNICCAYSDGEDEDEDEGGDEEGG